MVITLDADVVALADVSRLADEVRLWSLRTGTALFYAAEQQNKYRRSSTDARRAAWHRRQQQQQQQQQQQPSDDEWRHRWRWRALLDRLRASGAYRALLHRLRSELDDVIIGGHLERGIAHGLGDQTAFSAGAVIAPANWTRLVRLLPCEWNWQTCVWSYGRAHECPLYEGRLNKTRLAEQGYENLNCSHQPLLHDGSCSRPPRLLHFDCPGDLKALLVGTFENEDARAAVINHTAFSAAVARPPSSREAANRTVVELERGLKSQRAAAMCRRADSRPIGRLGRRGLASATFCNASFLLARLIRRGARASADNEGGAPPFSRRLAAMASADEQLQAPASWTMSSSTTTTSSSSSSPSWCRGILDNFEAEVVAPPQMPRVYVYDESLAPLATNPFGFALDDHGTTAASGPTYVNAMHARLLESPQRAYLPEEADLFFLPESAASNRSSCATLEARVDAYWAAWAANSAPPRPPSTTFGERAGQTTSRRRTFAHRCSLALRGIRPHSNRSPSSSACCNRPGLSKGGGCPSSGSPHAHSTARAGWLRARGCRTRRANTEAAATRLHIVEVPYGGSVHGADAWRVPRERPLLAVAAFNSRGHRNFHGQMDLRRALRAHCAAATSSNACRQVAFAGRYTLANTDDREGNRMLVATLNGYRDAVYSLQPAGDDPARKGLIDSVTSGCIPVVFQEQQRMLWPLHWGSWVNDATVLLPMDAVINGSLNVLDALRAIPQRRVARMQQTIRENAHTLHYALSGSAETEGDALEITLSHLNGASSATRGAPAATAAAAARCRRRARRARAAASTVR